MPSPRRTIAVSALFALAFAAAGAQPEEGSGLETSIRELSSSVDRLVAHLERDAAREPEEREARRVQVAASILELRLRKIERIDAEIRALDREEEEVRDAGAQLKSQLETLQSERGIPAEVPDSDARRIRAEFEARLKWTEDRVARIGARKLAAQNEKAEEERRIAGLEEILDSWIEGLQSKKPA